FRQIVSQICAKKICYLCLHLICVHLRETNSKNPAYSKHTHRVWSKIVISLKRYCFLGDSRKLFPDTEINQRNLRASHLRSSAGTNGKQTVKYQKITSKICIS